MEELDGNVSDLKPQLGEKIAELEKLNSKLEVASACVPDEAKFMEPGGFRIKRPQFDGNQLSSPVGSTGWLSIEKATVMAHS